MRRRPISPLFPYTTLFRSLLDEDGMAFVHELVGADRRDRDPVLGLHDLARNTDDHRSSFAPRSEEHTSELQSLRHLVCRLLLEKKKKTKSVCSRTSSRAPT